MADTTQPAGALPEPVHFRALLADDQRPQQLNSAMHVCGFRDRRTAENWVASKLDFDRWRYTLEPLYAEGDMRAMMAERDAALARAEFCLAFTRDAQALCATAQAEAAALRRELEELRKSGAPMANTMFNLAQRDSMPAHERESFKSMQVAWDAAPRAIPPDAREGREPLTEARAVDLLAAALRLANVMPGDTADVLYHFKRQLGPAGTTADGGTQWISVEERVPALVNDEDVPVYTWDGKTVTEDTYGPEFDQPAGPVVGGWLRVGENFGDIHRTVTHWMPRTIPAPPVGTSADGETQP